MSPQSTDLPRALHPGLRRLLWIAGGLVFIAGLQLFVFTEATDHYFAWTIKNPLTGAFLGAAYWASGVLEWAAARARSWERARIAVPAVLLFTLLTLIATLLGLAQFHLGAAFPWDTQVLTWSWLAIYAAVPPALIVMLLFQGRQPGHDSPATQDRPLPLWLRGGVTAQAVILVALGAMLFVAPQAAPELWPWTLTPLTARVIGAWLLGLGIAAAQVMLENDWGRAQPVAASCVAFSLLQAVALARYPEPFAWDRPAGWMYLAFLLSLLGLGLYGLITARAEARPA